MSTQEISVPEKFPYSYSALSKYKRCPYAYYLSYRKRIPRVSNPAAKFGTAVHYAMEIAFQNRKSGISQAVLMAAVQKKLIEEKTPPSLTGKFLNEASQILSRINYRGLFNGAIASEMRLKMIHRMPEGTPPIPILFISDLIVERSDLKGNGGIIWDYKTSKKMNAEEHKLQMSIYRACFMEIRGYLDTHCWVYFLRHLKAIRIPTLSVDDTWRVVEGIVAEIRAEKWSARASQHNCNRPWPCDAIAHCEYYRST